MKTHLVKTYPVKDASGAVVEKTLWQILWEGKHGEPEAVEAPTEAEETAQAAKAPWAESWTDDIPPF